MTTQQTFNSSGYFTAPSQYSKTVLSSAQPNITSVGVLNSLTVSGNIVLLDGASSVSIGSGGSGQIGNIVTGLTPGIPHVFSNSSGAIKLSDLDDNFAAVLQYSNLANTVKSSAQPNITSVGVLNSLTVIGNIVLLDGASNTVLSGDPNKLTSLTVSGNVTSQYYFGDGRYLSNIAVNFQNIGVIPSYLANLSCDIKTQGTIDAEYFAGNGYYLSGMYSNVDVHSYLPTYTGNLYPNNLTATGEVFAANLVSSGVVFGKSASIVGNILSGNLSTLGDINVNNNISVVNLHASGSVFASTLTISGNVVLGNLLTSGNVTAGYIKGNGHYLSGMYGNSDVSNFLPVYTGNIRGQNIQALSNISSGNISSTGTADITGNITTQNQIIANGSITTSGDLTVSGNTLLETNLVVNGMLSSVGNISSANYVTANNITSTNSIAAFGNISGNYFIGNGSALTGLYSNTNTANFLATNTGNITGFNITANNTVKANLFIGNFHGNITGNLVVPGVNTQVLFNQSGNAGADIGFTYNSDTQTAHISNTVNAVHFTGTTAVLNGNITANYLIGNGAFITGLPANYSNNDVAAYLPTNSTIANITSNIGNLQNQVYTNANVDAYLPTNSTIANITSNIGNLQNQVYTNANVAAYLPAYTGNITATGNVAGTYLIGNGAFITGLPANYSNNDVGNYLLNYSGNLFGNVLSINNIVNSGLSGVGNIGSLTKTFNTVFAHATSASYADLAENYTPDKEYPPGTVVVFGGSEEITISDVTHDTRVAGVISTKPAYLMNHSSPGIAVALTGRVPCWVQGPVNKGDLLVNKYLGVAGKMDPSMYNPGCIFGKSLTAITTNELLLIEVAVGRF